MWKTKKNKQLKQTSTSIWMGIASFAVITAMFATTAYAWASDTISNKGSKITAGKYAVSVMAVNDINETFDDANVIAKPDDPENHGVKWVNSMDISIKNDKFDSAGISEFYLSVSPFSDSTMDFRFQAQISTNDAGKYAIDKIVKRDVDGNFSEIVTEIKNDNVSIRSASSDVYKITVKNNSPQIGDSDAVVKFSMQSANVGQDIVPIKDIAELIDSNGAIAPNALLYLTEDIGTNQEGGIYSDYVDLLVKKLGTIDLNGHLLSVKSFKVISGTLGVVTVSNGTLVIGGEQVTDNKKIQIAEGYAIVAIKVDGLVSP